MQSTDGEIELLRFLAQIYPDINAKDRDVIRTRLVQYNKVQDQQLAENFSYLTPQEIQTIQRQKRSVSRQYYEILFDNVPEERKITSLTARM